MKITNFDNHHFLIGCDDRELLDAMQARMDGYKVRMKNQIVIPIKSGPKIYQFAKNGIDWDPKAKLIVQKIQQNAEKRIKNIRKIRAQYGGDIKFDYQVSGIYEPLAHQKIMYNVMMYSDVAAILADPGTCKTGPYLWAIDSKIKKGLIKKALVITFSNLKKNVLAEAAIQVPHLKCAILKDALSARKILQKSYKIAKKNIDYDIYIASYESMFSIKEFFGDEYFQMVVLDEAHRIGSPTSRQTKSIISKFENTLYKYIITGTLHSNNTMSFFMPFRFMGPDTVPHADYYDFRRVHMFTVDPNGYIWRDAPGTKEIVKQIVGGLSVVFTKDECLDLPPIIYQKLSCPMEGEQEKFYKEMERDLISTIDQMCSKCDKQDNCDSSCSNDIVAKSALVLSRKLHQIASGFYINTKITVDDNGRERNDSNTIFLKENPKLNLLIQTLNNIPQGKQVIIWSPYIPAIKLIEARLTDAFGKDCFITCYEDQDAFDQVRKFENEKIPYIIANPTKMGVGQNIQFSHYQIFFMNSYSFVLRDQAEGRQHRKGQNEKVTVIDLVTEGTIDEIVLKALLKKKDLNISLSQLAKVLKSPSEADKIIK